MTIPPQAQTVLLDDLQSDHDRFTTLVKRLSDEEQQRPFTVEGWTVKDFLAHMTHWKRATHAYLVAYLHDQPVPPTLPDGDEANAAQRPLDAPRSLQEVHTDWEEVHTHLRHIVIDELDENRLVEEMHVPWNEHEMRSAYALVADICQHDAEHFALIERHF